MKNIRKRSDKNPKLKALAVEFKKAHEHHSADLVHSAYRLTKEAAEIGDIVLAIQKEGKFKTKRRVWLWLQTEIELQIPKTTFYRYVNASEWWKEAEIVHGKEALTDISSLKALKLLARPKVEFDPIDEGWTKKGSNYTRTVQGVHAEVRCEEGKKPYVWINGKCETPTGGLREAITIAEEKVAHMAQQPPATIPHSPHLEAPDAVIEGGDDLDPDDEDDEEQKPQEAAQEPMQTPQVPTNGTPAQPTVNGTPQPNTCFHDACRNFQLDANTLKCLDQKNRTVVLFAPKKQQMPEILQKLLANSASEKTEAKPKAKKKSAKKKPIRNRRAAR